MGFYNTCSRYKNSDLDLAFNAASSDDVRRALGKDRPAIRDFAAMLSPAAEGFLEEMAQKSHDITVRNFGRVIQLYTPLYLSNYCENECAYCGFSAKNRIERRRLEHNEVEEEARIISSMGIKDALILTGESRSKAPVAYIKECVKILKSYFISIAIEIYPLTEEEYSSLVSAGVDGLTIYQEAYDKGIYAGLHPAGPKKDYAFRLDAPERGCRAGMRSVNIGTLLGLDDWRKEAFLTGLHAKYLQDNFPSVNVGVSVPRIKPHAGSFRPLYKVGERDVARIIMALRLFMPRLNISVSTRESAAFRENAVDLGVTRMSAASSTAVGARLAPQGQGRDAPQFEISDRSGVDDVVRMLERKGYQPVFKDWLPI